MSDDFGNDFGNDFAIGEASGGGGSGKAKYRLGLGLGLGLLKKFRGFILLISGIIYGLMR